MKSKEVVLKVDGEEKTFKMNALSWDDFPKLMDLLSKLNVKGEKEEDILKSLDENNMTKLMDLEYKMFKKSYPEMTEQEVKDIILENVFVLLDPLVSVNFTK